MSSPMHIGSLGDHGLGYTGFGIKPAVLGRICVRFMHFRVRIYGYRGVFVRESFLSRRWTGKKGWGWDWRRVLLGRRGQELRDPNRGSQSPPLDEERTVGLKDL